MIRGNLIQRKGVYNGECRSLCFHESALDLILLNLLEFAILVYSTHPECHLHIHRLNNVDKLNRAHIQMQTV